MLTKEQAVAILTDKAQFMTDSKFDMSGDGCEVGPDGSVSVRGYVIMSVPKSPLVFNVVTGSFVVPKVKLESFEGIPRRINGSLDLPNQKSLTSFSQLPTQKVRGDICVSGCGLTDLVGIPERFIGKNGITGKSSLIAANNPLVSLKGLERFTPDSIYLSYSDHLPLLRVLTVKDPNGIHLAEQGAVLDSESKPTPTTNQKLKHLMQILRDHAGIVSSQKWKGVLACQRILMNEGFAGNAKW